MDIFCFYGYNGKKYNLEEIATEKEKRFSQLKEYGSALWYLLKWMLGSYMASGYDSLYHKQKIMFAKTRTGFAMKE